MAGDTPSIFKATYSNVPVYEMPCKGVAVMKRRSDGWLNATQILKVAGFDKPQRTRVLEREVQKGTHEKVQGGYGKYQGTWIPVDRGIQLAQQYGVLEPLQPIIDYVPAGASPPPAPKHVTAAPKGPRQKRGTPAGASTPISARASSAAAANAPSSSSGPLVPQLQGQMPPPPAPAVVQRAGRANKKGEQQQAQQAQAQPKSRYASSPQVASKPEVYDDQEEELSPGPSDVSSASRTPSPLGSEAPSEFSDLYSNSGAAGGGGGARKRKHAEMGIGGGPDGPMMMMQHQRASQGGPAYYARMILDYFVSESAQIPSFLISPPSDFDPNVVIDDDGHTALHWACAMGRIRIVKLLLTAGADIFRANAMGQTALMRSVMFTNNYDLRKYPELFELLHRSTINIDRNDRTVFHYVIDIALSKGKVSAARYYLEVILERLKEYPREVCDILNFQDEEGETALTLAARARSKNLVKTLLHHGADPKITNRDGKSAEDYILEDERVRHGPQGDGQQQQQLAMSGSNAGPGPSPLQQSQLANSSPGSVGPANMGGAGQGLHGMEDPSNLQHGQPSYLQQHQQQPVMGMQYPSSMTVGGGPLQQNGYYAGQQPYNPAYAPQNQGQHPQMQLDPIPHSAPQHQHPMMHAAYGHGLATSGASGMPTMYYSEAGQQVATQIIPQVTEHLENLASDFDAQLESKERDITQAHALLANIQAEVLETQRISASLKPTADSLEEYQAREAALQTELQDKMGKRFRLGWEKYVRDEEERQKPYVTIAKTASSSSASSEKENNNNNNGHGQANGGYTVTLNNNPAGHSKNNGGTSGGGTGEIPADIGAIFAAPSSSGKTTAADALSSATRAASEQLAKLKVTRRELFETFVNLQAEAGAGEKINEYRKLIALGCGIQPHEVDYDLVTNLLDNLDDGQELGMAALNQPQQQALQASTSSSASSSTSMPNHGQNQQQHQNQPSRQQQQQQQQQ